MLERNACLLSAALHFLLLGAPVEAGDPVTIGEREVVRSRVLDEERPLLVSLPSDYESGSARYPVLYVLGSGNFVHTAATVDLLARVGHIPAMIVVGVENTARTRDLTTPWTASDPPPEMARAIQDAGGADRYLEFLTGELVPQIDERYRTSPFRVLMGHSLGGLFTLHALFTAPDSFHGYIAISPSVHWDTDVVLREADAFLERGLESPRFLFATIANENDLAKNFRALVERLRYDAPNRLRWAHREFPEEDHGSIPLVSTPAGLRSIFDGYRTPSHLAETLDGLDKHHAGLTERFGYEIPVPEAAINVLGFRALFTGDTQSAIDVFSENVARYPDSPNAHDMLGQALEADGQLELAISSFEKAVALASERGHANLAYYRQHLDAARVTPAAP